MVSTTSVGTKGGNEGVGADTSDIVGDIEVGEDAGDAVVGNTGLSSTTGDVGVGPCGGLIQ